MTLAGDVSRSILRETQAAAVYLPYRASFMRHSLFSASRPGVSIYRAILAVLDVSHSAPPKSPLLLMIVVPHLADSSAANDPPQFHAGRRRPAAGGWGGGGPGVLWRPKDHHQRPGGAAAVATKTKAASPMGPSLALEPSAFCLSFCSAVSHTALALFSDHCCARRKSVPPPTLPARPFLRPCQLPHTCERPRSPKVFYGRLCSILENPASQKGSSLAVMTAPWPMLSPPLRCPG